jgi:hypothetical protein
MIAELLEVTQSEMITLFASAVAVLLVSTFLGYRIGARKARPMLGVALGGLLTVPGLLLIELIPAKEPEFY